MIVEDVAASMRCYFKGFYGKSIWIDSEELQPVFDRVEACLEKLDNLLKNISPGWKCEKCLFEARNIYGLNSHVKAKH